ncbi:BamA/TamA family outer membrane protein [bacterium]|nr:BamA/TamA family outer membrane protein [bacterium]
MDKIQLQRKLFGARAILVGLAAFCCLGGVPRTAGAVSELDYGLGQHLLHRIVIRGNTTFSGDDLKALMKIREPRWFHPLMIIGLSDRKARYQPHLLEAELKQLSRYYRHQGFHQVSVGLDSVGVDPEGRGDVIHISIVEGPRTYLSDVRFEGGFSLAHGELAKGLRYRPGVPAPADLNALGADIYLMRTRFWEHGHLDVSILPSLTVRDAATQERRDALLVYSIDAGSAYTIGQITVEGQRRSRLELITRELRVREGDIFRWSAVERSQRQLLETALFRDVSFIPANTDTTAATADLLVQVVERSPAFFEFGLGVGSRERIRLLAAWGHNNLFGTGQRLRLRTRNYLNYEDVQRLSANRVDPELNYRYDILHTYPRLFGRFLLDTNLFLAKETRGESGLNLESQGFSFGTRFQGGPHVINTVELRVEEVDPNLHPDAKQSLREAYEASELRSSDTRSVGWAFYEEGRNNPLRPDRGTLRTMQMEVGGGPLGGDNSFVKIAAGLHAYHGTPLGGVLAWRVSAGAVRPYGGSRDRGADGVPYQERFFAGGASTVRGYLERSLGPQITDQAVRDSLRLASDVPLSDQPARGGNYLLLTNVEWRFPMPLFSQWRVDGVAFVDGGNVWERASDIRLRGFRWRSHPRDPADDSATRTWDYRYSVGCGVRIHTPVGPVRLDVGFPLKRARLTNTEFDDASDFKIEDKAIYHFSLGFPF